MWRVAVAFLASTWAGCATPVAALGTPIVAFEDPIGDDAGPGTYAAPTDPEFVEGDFDLRRVAVLLDRDDVVFEVTLGAAIRRPQVMRRKGSTDVALWNGIYLQNVDIYVDTDRSTGSGSAACIPGRRVAFADGRTWEVAVVLTPQPGPARSVTEGALGKDAGRVHFAQGLEVRGRTLAARVPRAAFGAGSPAEWGYSVHLSGASWDRSFNVLDRIRGENEANAYTMPVLVVGEEWAFGGAPDGNLHPRLIDVLLPPGVDQRDVLTSFKRDPIAFAQVPFVDAGPTPSRSPPSAPTPGTSGDTGTAPPPGSTR